jgi:hypothetical protein
MRGPEYKKEYTQRDIIVKTKPTTPPKCWFEGRKREKGENREGSERKYIREEEMNVIITAKAGTVQGT